jgi:predicted TIM-barrel fold metal-dependent hydrolase
MILDCHVHVSAFDPGHGSMSPRLLASLPFAFMRWNFGLKGSDSDTERQVEKLLTDSINGATELDGAVVLAFDAVYDRDGNIDLPNTHLYVTNDYVIELAARHPRIFFAASVHPYRKDAVAELERCVAAGAVVVKWLPITQNFNPADDRCIPFYEALAHLGIPLLSHTGWEHTLPNLDKTAADPMLLREAVRRGVVVIAAHCGAMSIFPWEIGYLENWARMARDFEHFYGDTAALNSPGGWHAYDTILNDPVLRGKLVHGSDWPVISIPPARLGAQACIDLMGEWNWIKRDVLIKRKLFGSDDEYWGRAAKVLKVVKSGSSDSSGCPKS